MAINIFISHKHEDEHAAIGIRDVLKKFDDDEEEKLHFFLSEEIPGGANWYEWIKGKLVESNLLLLLFTDVTKSWDWCLYEAGLFDRLDDTHRRRVICLHSSVTTPPDPLQHLQAFAAIPNRLKTFLKQLFLETELTQLVKPIAPWVNKAPEKLDEAASEIAALIDRKPIESDYFTKYIFVHVQDPKALTQDRIPPDADVISNQRSLEIFDKSEGCWKWGDLEKNARLNEDKRWIDELAQAIFAASRGNLPNAIQALFHPRRGKTVYRPVLYRVDKLADGSMIFKVLFDEDVSWKLDDVPVDHATLLTSLVMATRFKYELIEKYLGELDDLPQENAIATCDHIRQTILNIESEAQSRGLLDQTKLIKIFDEEYQTTIKGMYRNWDVIRSKIFDALDSQSCQTVEQQLSELAQINKEYLRMASERYRQIMSD